MTERPAFGADLRRARERRGLTLEQIAEQTKVSAALFAGMERDDFSRWPSGIFRRAFIRSYAVAVGLDPDEVVARFVELHPEPDGESSAVPVAAGQAEAQATGKPWSAPAAVVTEARRTQGSVRLFRAARRAAAATVDVVLAVAPALVVASVLGRDWFWPCAACLGLGGHVLVLSLTGCTPGTWLLMADLAQPAAGPELTAWREPQVEQAPPAPPSRRRQGRHANVGRQSVRPRHLRR